jgi:CDP-diacylglycerol--glycerol-3-phosphate 3-phosphatidyltransferase
MSEPAVSESAVPADGPAPRVSLVNIANALTILRIVLVPVFVVLLVASELEEPAYRVAAAVAFGAASVTDFVDGWLARALNQVTSFGKVADPIADKALTGTALVLLSIMDALPWWVTIVVLTREIGVTVLRLWVLRHGVMAASRGGKVKTVLQIFAITWYILPLSPTVGAWIMGAAVVVTVVTGVDYVIRALRLRREAAACRTSADT